MNVSPTTATSPSDLTTPSARATGPTPGIPATVYVALFLAGLIAVSGFVTKPSFPAPSSGPAAIVAYFQTNPMPIRSSAFLSFGAVLALAVFIACVVNRLRFLGIRTVWLDIALVAGLTTAFDQVASHLCEWALTWPAITHDTSVTLAFFYLLYAFGGPGFAVPMGLFVGSIAVASARWSLLPGWMVWIGAIIAVIGVVSWLNLLLPEVSLVTFTIPLTRFPAFAWLIVAGFMLPSRPASHRT